MADVVDYSTTAASNNDPPPDGWPEGMAPSAINNCAREMQAADARDLLDRNGSLSTTGTAPDYALTLNRTSITVLSDGILIGFRVHAANSGAATTLDVNGIGASPVELPDGSDPVLLAGSIYQAVWDNTGSRWQILSATVAQAALPSFVAVATSRTLASGDLNGPLLNVTGGTVTLSLPNALLGPGDKLRILAPVAATFTLANGTVGSTIFRTDGGTAIIAGGSDTLSSSAYTLIGGASGEVVLVGGIL